jgi:hypothetical protein
MTIFVNKGDLPLTPFQLQRRSQKYVNRAMPVWVRERSLRKGGPQLAAFNTLMTSFETDDAVNKSNNTFNWQLQEYRKATARLQKYRLADGVPEYTVETPTGTYDDEGVEIVDVTTVAAIEPLEATVEVTTYDEEGVATTETVANPLIVQDDAEREAAQAVVDATPQEVKDFV